MSDKYFTSLAKIKRVCPAQMTELTLLRIKLPYSKKELKKPKNQKIFSWLLQD